MTLAGDRKQQPLPSKVAGKKGGRTLLVFDFDHTLIDVNSDTWILEKVSSRLYEHMLTKRKDGVQWTSLMDECIGMALQMEGESVETIKDRFRGIVVHPDMVRLLSFAAGLDNVHVAIVSDANLHYIEWILEWNGMLHLVDEIVSNPSTLTTTSMRIMPLYDHGKNRGHLCDRGCPENICKADILMQLCRGERFDIERAPAETVLPLQELGNVVIYDTVLYCGDGNNDHHPCTILRASHDHVLPRKGYALLNRITAQGEHGAHVHPWESYEELAQQIASLVPDLSAWQD